MNLRHQPSPFTGGATAGHDFISRFDCGYRSGSCPAFSSYARSGGGKPRNGRLPSLPLHSESTDLVSKVSLLSDRQCESATALYSDGDMRHLLSCRFFASIIVVGYRAATLGRGEMPGVYAGKRKHECWIVWQLAWWSREHPHAAGSTPAASTRAFSKRYLGGTLAVTGRGFVSGWMHSHGTRQIPCLGCDAGALSHAACGLSESGDVVSPTRNETANTQLCATADSFPNGGRSSAKPRTSGSEPERCTFYPRESSSGSQLALSRCWKCHGARTCFCDRQSGPRFFMEAA